MLLADAAQNVNGKLYILGGGWTVTRTPTPPMAVAIKLEIPWGSANQPLPWTLHLQDADGSRGVMTDGSEVLIRGVDEVGRPPGLVPGTPIDSAIVASFGPLDLSPGRYEWRFEIDGAMESCGFSAKPG